MPKTYERAICWIRRDLRLTDHAPLAAATGQAMEVAVAFVFDTCILDNLPDKNDRRLTFIHDSLKELDEKLRKQGSRLVVLHGDPAEVIPKVAKELGAQAIFTARDYEPYARKRDEEVRRRLEELGVTLETVKDTVVLEGGEVLTREGHPFRVYTPYSRAWRSRFDAKTDADEHRPDLRKLISAPSLPSGTSIHQRSLEILGFERSKLWLEPGERAGQQRLQAFERNLPTYEEDRNFPAKERTSGLSVHLRFGTISIRQCVRAALEAGPSGAAWMSELIWRDFFQDVLFHHPYVVDQPFRPEYRNLHYPGPDAHFEAWCQGQTGYPIVDAAMRHFNATGWMHNRLRMVCASFLTKDLLVDYRKGEAYFARYLLDFDLAANNGNWQWAASTGCDAQPYFRVFNPITQSEKFGPNGDFIRATIPELRDLTTPAIHFPPRATEFELTAAGLQLGQTYPHPIVDHAKQREKAIQLLMVSKTNT